MKIGYARVSTAEQQIDLQRDALKQAGCDAVYHDVASGAKAQRPGLQTALDHLRPGDILLVWKLDRLGRSLKELIDIVQQLQDQQVGFQSLQENIDTTTTGGKLVFHLFSALAEFERGLIRDRTYAGLQAARARGKKGGRPPQLSAKQVNKMLRYYHERKNTVNEICTLFGIGRSCFYNYLHKAQKKAAQTITPG